MMRQKNNCIKLTARGRLQIVIDLNEEILNEQNRTTVEFNEHGKKPNDNVYYVYFIKILITLQQNSVALG